MKYGLIIAVLLLAGCAEDPQSSYNTTNKNVPVDLLFEHDGCRVYRFYDAGEWLYYANCGSGSSASTTWDQLEGKVKHPKTLHTTGE